MFACHTLVLPSALLFTTTFGTFGRLFLARRASSDENSRGTVQDVVANIMAMT